MLTNTLRFKKTKRNPFQSEIYMKSYTASATHYKRVRQQLAEERCQPDNGPNLMILAEVK